MYGPQLELKVQGVGGGGGGIFGLFFIFAQICLILLILPNFCSFVDGKTKESFCFSNVFCIYYFSKTNRKPARKNTEKCFPIHL